jgi:NADH-quinone oxidoreductase subunit L
MFRIYFVTFWGPPRTPNAEHAHEAPVVMWLPLAILAILSAVAGFVPMGQYVGIGEAAEHHGIDWSIAAKASPAALLGIALAGFFYLGDTQRATRAAQAFGVAYRTVKQKFYIDEVYLFITHRIIIAFISRPIAWFDRHVVDGGVNLSGWATRMLGANLRRTQTGQVQTYGAWCVGGMLLVAMILWAALR